MFSGKLGRYKKRTFKLKMKPNAVPYHCKRPYAVPHRNLKVMKEELDSQVDKGILAPCGETEWAMPVMVISKKDGTIRIVDDAREVNKWLIRKCYIMPKITDIFHRRDGFIFCSKLDLTLCYYAYVLDEESTWYCVIVTPFGKYRRLRLPMGLTQSPDWAQAAIEEAFRDTELLRKCVEVYIDDVGVFSNSWEEHLMHLDQTLQVLEENGYTVNPAKCEWCVAEMEWLGHKITQQGIKPLPSKIKGILQLNRPTNVTALPYTI